MPVDSAIIEPHELSSLLERGEPVKLVDASYGVPALAYPHFRIGNAVYFDIDVICDPNSSLPHMLPSPEGFVEEVSRLGLNNSDPIVIYDQTGIFMAASRVWWMFRVFGHDNVRVLNGGLAYWKALGLELNTEPPISPEPSSFAAQFHPSLVSNRNDIQINLGKSHICLLDARSAERFNGEAPEPRPGMVSGHMPGSVNLPFLNILESPTGRLRDRKELEHLLAPISEKEHIITTCGSGVTACVLALALFELGRKDVAVYDGSWSEWGQKDQKMPIETSP